MEQERFLTKTGDTFKALGVKVNGFLSDLDYSARNTWNDNEVAEKMRSFWEMLADWAKNVWETIKKGLRAVGDGFVWLGHKIVQIGGKVVEGLKIAGLAIYNGIKNFTTFIGKKLADAFNWLKENLPKLGKKIKEGFTTFVENIKKFFAGIAKKTGAFFSKVGNKIKEFSSKFVSSMKTLKKKMSEKWASVCPKIKNFFSKAKAKIVAGVACVVAGVKYGASKFKNFVVGVKDKIAGKFSAMKEKSRKRKEERALQKQEKQAKKELEKEEKLEKLETVNEDINDIQEYWEAVRSNLQRSELNETLSKAIDVDQFVKLGDNIFKKNADIIAQNTDKFNNFEECLAYISEKKPKYKEDCLNIMDMMDKLNSELNSNTFTLSEKEQIQEFLDEIRVDEFGYGFGLDEFVRQELEDTVLEENERNEVVEKADSIEESELVDENENVDLSDIDAEVVDIDTTKKSENIDPVLNEEMEGKDTFGKNNITVIVNNIYPQINIKVDVHNEFNDEFFLSVEEITSEKDASL